MKSYLFKELFLNKSTLFVLASLQALSIAAVVMCSVYYGNSDIEFSETVCVALQLMNFAFAHFFGSMFKNDEKHSWTDFACSSPQTFKGQILAKYVYLFSINLIILISGIIMSMFILNLKASSFSVLCIFLFFGICVLLDAIKLPFIYRFGYSIGSKCGLISLGVIVFATLIYVLFGDISFIDFNDLWGSILDFANNNGIRNVVAVICIVCVPCYAVSLMISSNVYKKGIEVRD